MLTTLAAQAAVAIENARLVGDLRRANEQLGKLDKLKSDFIAIASHELRTPLGLILLYAALLRDQMKDETGQQLDAVLRAAMRLRHIIETMLNLRHLETGEIALTPSCFDLRAEIQDACEDYEVIAETDEVTLITELPEGEVFILADQEKVRVVLDNLISNAVKFTPAGGRVQVLLACQDDEVEVAVGDTGIGMSKKQISHVFEEFYKADDSRHDLDSSGLGLPICKRIIKKHGGQIWAESLGKNKGSTFYFTLKTGRN